MTSGLGESPRPLLFSLYSKSLPAKRVPVTRLTSIVLQGTSEPVKVFDRAPTLAANQIINYRMSPDEKWLVLIGIAPGAPEVRDPRPQGIRDAFCSSMGMQSFAWSQSLCVLCLACGRRFLPRPSPSGVGDPLCGVFPIPRDVHIECRAEMSAFDAECCFMCLLAGRTLCQDRVCFLRAEARARQGQHAAVVRRAVPQPAARGARRRVRNSQGDFSVDPLSCEAEGAFVLSSNCSA